MAVLHTDLSPEDFTAHLRSRLSSPRVQADHYEGWFLGRFFSVGYLSAAASARKYYPVRNRMLGWVTPEGPGSRVLWFRFRGYTDPLALAAMFLGCLLFLALLYRAGGHGMWDLGYLTRQSGRFTLIVAGLTWLWTTAAPEGAQGRHRLGELME